jgi:hypothetical protein
MKCTWFIPESIHHNTKKILVLLYEVSDAAAPQTGTICLVQQPDRPYPL